MRQLSSRVILALAVLLLAACSTAGPTSDGETNSAAPAWSSSEPGASARQLVGVQASVYQSRLDVVASQLEVQLTNGSDTGFTVLGLSLESSGFESPMTSQLSNISIGSGRVVDLPVLLGPAVCTGGRLEHTVRLDYVLDDGQVGTLTVPADDQGGRIVDLHDAECFEQEVNDLATLSITGLPEVRTLGEALVADLVVEVTPGGGPGVLELVRVRNTTLLQLIDPDTGERRPEGRQLDLMLPDAIRGEAAPHSVVLTVVPARCDAHAVAEDKQGTRFRFDVELDGREGTVGVSAPREVTVELYDFVQRACQEA